MEIDEKLALLANVCSECGALRISLMIDCPSCGEQYANWKCCDCGGFLNPYGGGYCCPSCGKLYFKDETGRVRQKKAGERRPDKFLRDAIEF